MLGESVPLLKIHLIQHVDTAGSINTQELLFSCPQVALELIKVVGGYEFESFKNCFFNLAIPVVVLTEPAKVKNTPIR